MLSVPHPGSMELFGSSGLRLNSTATASRSGVTEAVRRNALPGACKPSLYHSSCTIFQACTAVLAAAGQIALHQTLHTEMQQQLSNKGGGCHFL